MQVLLMGFRLGAAKALEKLEIPYIIWSEKPLKNPRQCKSTIIDSFPNSESNLEHYQKELSDITHVVAVTEAAVIPASFCRKKLGLKRNKDSVIVRCTDKLEMKKFLSSKDIPMTDFIVAKDISAKDIVKQLGLPVVCKVKLSSGGRGVSFLNTIEEVEMNIKRGNYFEKRIEGTEGSIESFVQDGKIIFRSMTEYYKNGVCNLVPAHYSDEIKQKIEELNQNVLKALKVKWGITHLEYYIDQNKNIFFGEIALRPPGGYLMEILPFVYGKNYWEKFIQVETGVTPSCSSEIKMYASSIVIHPGEGRVSEIQGREKLESLASFKKLKLKLGVGDMISKREGVGEDFGYLFLAHENQDQLKKDLKTYFSEFQIKLSS